MTYTYCSKPDSRECNVKNITFYPLAINLQDRKVLVIGGGEQAYREILRLIDAGAILTIVAPETNQSIGEVLVTHASKAHHLPLTASDFITSVDKNSSKYAHSLNDFTLAFLLSEQEGENDIVAKRLNDCGVPFHCLHKPDQSKLVTATALKRGHLKIAVSTDGLCHPLERAISRRIEEIFVSDFDHYSIFLSAVEEKLNAVKEESEENWLKLSQRLDSEDFYLALARKNFEEALRMVDLFTAAIERGQTEEDDEDADEVEVNMPRKSSKGANK